MKKIKWVLLLCVSMGISFATVGCTNSGSQASVEESVFMPLPSLSKDRSEEIPEESEVQQSNEKYEYMIQEIYTKRDSNQIFGVAYIPQNTEDKMPAVIFFARIWGFISGSRALCTCFGGKWVCMLLF